MERKREGNSPLFSGEQFVARGGHVSHRGTQFFIFFFSAPKRRSNRAKTRRRLLLHCLLLCVQSLQSVFLFLSLLFLLLFLSIKRDSFIIWRDRDSTAHQFFNIRDAPSALTTTLYRMLFWDFAHDAVSPLGIWNLGPPGQLPSLQRWIIGGYARITTILGIMYR